MRTLAPFPHSLVLSGVTKSFRAGAGNCVVTVAVLHDVEIRLRCGEALAIVGPHQSGKSTLLQCAAGLLRPDEGNVRWMTPHSGRRQIRRPRYLDLDSVGGRTVPPVFAPALPILLVDSCDHPSLAVRQLARRVIQSARASGETILLAARTADRCADLFGEGSIAIAHLERGRLVDPVTMTPRIVEPGSLPQRYPSRVAEGGGTGLRLVDLAP